MDADVPENYVAQLSGHKNLKSLDYYKSASTTHQRKMSMVLSESARHTEATTSRQEQEIDHAAFSQSSVFYKRKDVSKQAVDGIFSGANISAIHNCSFNFYMHNPSHHEGCHVKKPRKVIISDDSDSD